MSLTDPMAERLSRDLEPVLSMSDPRTKLSAYHDMPYAIFRYDPDGELELRRHISLLETRNRPCDTEHPDVSCQGLAGGDGQRAGAS